MKKQKSVNRYIASILICTQFLNIFAAITPTEADAVYSDSYGTILDDFTENDLIVNGEQMHKYYVDNGYKGLGLLPGSRSTINDIYLPQSSKMPVNAGAQPEDYLIKIKAHHSRNSDGDQVIRWRVATRGGMEGTGQWVSPMAYVARPYYLTSVSRGLEMPTDVFYYDPHAHGPSSGSGSIHENLLGLIRASRYVHNVENNWHDWYDNYRGSDGRDYRIMGNDSWSKKAGVANDAATEREYMDSYDWFGLTGISNGYEKNTNGTFSATNNFNPEKLLKFSKYYFNDWQSTAPQHKSRVITFNTKINIAEVNAIGSSAGISRAGKNVASNNVYSEFWDLAGRGGEGRVINGQVAEPGMSGHVWVMQGVRHMSNTGDPGASGGMQAGGIYVFQKAEMVRVYTDAEDFQPTIPVNNIIVALRETANKDNILNYIKENIVLGNDKRGTNYNHLRDRIITGISWVNNNAIPTHTAGVYNAPVRITYKDGSSENVNIPITVLPGIKNTSHNDINKPQDLVIWNNTPLTNTSLVIPVHDGDKNPTQNGLQSMIENVYFVGGGNITNRILGGLSISNTGAFSGSQNTDFIGIYNANVVVENNVVGTNNAKRKAMSTGIWVLIFDAKDKYVDKDVQYPAPTQEEVKQAALSAVNRGNFSTESNHAKYPVTAEIKQADISKIPPQYPNKVLNPVPVTLRNADGQEKVINVIYRYNVADITNDPNATVPEGYHKVTFEIPDGQGNLVALNQNVTRKVYLVKNGTPKERILPGIQANSEYILQSQNWRKNGQEGGSDVPNTITETATYVAYLRPVNSAPSIAKRNIVIWKTDNHDIKTGLKDVIQDQEIPITDPDNPMTFNASNISVVADGTNNRILPNISFKIQNGKVYMTGYADEHTRHTANFKVTDGPHNVTGPDIWLFVAEANGGDIIKNIGEQVTRDEVLNKVVVSPLSDLDTSKITKDLYTDETLPAVNENKTVFVKVTYSDTEKANVQYKVVPVNILYNVIDRTDNTSEQTPNGYVRITLQAEANKGQLSVGSTNVTTKVYDVKVGTERSVIDNLVTITPNNNYQVANQKWKDSNSQDIPQVINNSGSYTAQFEQKLYVNTNNGNLEDIFVWKINENPDASSDRYRQMESVSTYTLPVKDRVTPATFNNVYFVNQSGVRSDVGSLSLTFDNTQNVVKLTGYANTAPGFNTRAVKATDQAGNTLTTNSIWVVAFDASANPINKNVGETTTEEEIKAAVNINYGNYPDNAETRANRVVTKEIISETKPANLNEGSYVVKVKLTNVKGMAKVVDVPVNYSLIDKTNEPNSPVTPGYVRITLTAENNKGQLTVNNQNVQTKVYDVKSGTNRSVIDNLVTLTPNTNWRVVETQKWKDDANADIPQTINTTENNKTYTAQFEEIDKAPYFESNTGNVNVGNYNDKIVIWKGENITKNLPIKDKDSASIEEGSLYFVDKVRDERSDFGNIILGITTNNQNEQQVTLSGKTDEAVGLYERRIKVKDSTHSATNTGIISINVIDATANEITIPFGTLPTENDVKKAININSQGTNLTDKEREITYKIKPDGIIPKDNKLVINVELTNSSGQSKTISVPIKYNYKSIKMNSSRPVRNSKIIKVNSEANGRTIKLYINEGKNNAVVMEKVLSEGIVEFNLQTALKKGDNIKIEMVKKENEVTPPLLLYKVR